ncbi:hypothetical protein EJ110_NYTH30169 [Nymphaea thermarum]|nr:hypothetical protein EJ110_NYTH30169 [Nymphaea thermarum]
MGNSISPCFHPLPDGSESPASAASASTVRLIFADGKARVLQGNQPASDVMVEHPDCNVYHAESFFIGRRVTPVDLSDVLLAGNTYFVLPVDRFDCGVLLTASSLASSPATSSLNHHNIWSLGDSPFEYVKGSDGRRAIKVCPEFIVGVLKKAGEANAAAGGTLCSSPELQRQYTMLVGSKNQGWSPKLETITEATAGLSRRKFGRCSSPCAFFLDRRYRGEVYE